MSSARSAAAAGPTTTLATNGAREPIERDAFAGADLAPAQFRALVRAGDAVEQGDDVARVGVRLVFAPTSWAFVSSRRDHRRR